MFCLVFPRVSAMAVLQPSIVEGHLFKSLNRYQKKLQMSPIEGFLNSTCFSVHQRWKTFHLDV